MNSASYEYRKMSARRGAKLAQIRMQTVCWKTFPEKTTKILSTQESENRSAYEICFIVPYYQIFVSTVIVFENGGVSDNISGSVFQFLVR